MAKTENGYCPEGECDCLDPCETTAEDYERMVAETEPTKGDFDCCIPRAKNAPCSVPPVFPPEVTARCNADTFYGDGTVRCAQPAGHEGNHRNLIPGVEWFNTAELADEPLADWERKALESVEAVDMVNHPPHYSDCGTCRQCGSKVEVIQITEGMGFNLGNAVKYVLRCDKKHDAIEDLKKAAVGETKAIILCNATGCDDRVEAKHLGSWVAVQKAVEKAKARGWSGWSSRSARHYCPAHTPSTGHKMRRVW